MLVTIKKFKWGNPHNQIYLEVTDENSVAGHKPFTVGKSYSSDAWVRVKITAPAVIDKKIFGGENLR